MEADFQQYYGLDVSTVKLSRGARLLFQLPTSSRVITKLHPQSQWGWPEVLANKANFLLETLVWQNGYDPKKKAQSDSRKPKLFVPEFMQSPVKPSPLNEGSVAMLPHEIDQWLNLPRE